MEADNKFNPAQLQLHQPNKFKLVSNLLQPTDTKSIALLACIQSNECPKSWLLFLEHIFANMAEDGEKFRIIFDSLQLNEGQHYAQYRKTSEEYLGCWILRAQSWVSATESPNYSNCNKIFQRLHEFHIGTQFCRLYLEWSKALIAVGKYSLAKEKLLLCPDFENRMQSQLEYQRQIQTIDEMVSNNNNHNSNRNHNHNHSNLTDNSSKRMSIISNTTSTKSASISISMSSDSDFDEESDSDFDSENENQYGGGALTGALPRRVLTNHHEHEHGNNDNDNDNDNDNIDDGILHHHSGTNATTNGNTNTNTNEDNENNHNTHMYAPRPASSSSSSSSSSSMYNNMIAPLNVTKAKKSRRVSYFSKHAHYNTRPLTPNTLLKNVHKAKPMRINKNKRPPLQLLSANAHINHSNHNSNANNASNHRRQFMSSNIHNNHENKQMTKSNSNSVLSIVQETHPSERQNNKQYEHKHNDNHNHAHINRKRIVNHNDSDDHPRNHSNNNNNNNNNNSNNNAHIAKPLQFVATKTHDDRIHNNVNRHRTQNTNQNTNQDNHHNNVDSGRPTARANAARVKNGMFQKMRLNGSPFLILSQVGRGGSANVYKVISADSGVIYALKRIKIKYNMNVIHRNIEIQNYKNEISLLQSLKTESRIISMIDHEITANADTKDTLILILFELGEIDLAHVLRREKATLTNILHYWEGILLCIQVIHKCRIIHGDLKPANFLLVSGTLKLIDFGIAKQIVSNDTTHIARESQIGTLNYMSPEAILESNSDSSNTNTNTNTNTNANSAKTGANPSASSSSSSSSSTASARGPEKKYKLSRASDIWSLGCILHQMCFGCTPFTHLKTLAKILFIVNEKHSIEIQKHPECSEIYQIVSQCLQRDPIERCTLEYLLYEHRLQYSCMNTINSNNRMYE